MNLSIKTAVCVLVVAFFLLGCAYQRRATLARTGLPEEIFATPRQNYYSTSNVGIFKFTEPSYAPGMGKAAAQSIYQELLRNRVFLNSTPELDIKDMGIDNLIDIARAKKYDLVITGDLLYYFEGSLHQPSRVDERILVIDVPTNRTLWYAKAVDIASPAPYADYILIEWRGVSAPTTMTLLKRNAEKFCKMLLNSPPQESSATAQKNKQFCEQDYHHMTRKDDSTERPFLEVVSEHKENSVPAVAPAQKQVEPKRLSAEEESRAAQKALENQRLQEEQLRQDDKMRSERAERERFLNEHIHFEFDESRLLPEANEILERKAIWLRAHPKVSVIIAGHCDERGTYESNMVLGDRRAQSTKSYLVDLGIEPERLTTLSYGQERPLDPGHNEKAWAKNRRAQFVIK